MEKNITFLPVLVHSVKDLIDFGRRYLEKEVIRIVFGFFLHWQQILLFSIINYLVICFVLFYSVV